ncbi:melanopsin-A-like isoform X2 [Cololabis saira]|uniref:melanopsin-A-like isoform X2 n=1 Tax=Cololabis saira TaxID=129043 RepID=UPI002AD46045|nr:melanopsin-A-like isoform X2 [Cololabis saira]
MAPGAPFPTVDVPDHAHYTIGSVILAIGITGVAGNLLVIYAFSRSRSLRTPPNMFIINLAVTDLLMCLTQSPVFFTTSMSRRWIFGEKGAYVPEGLLTSCSWDYMSFTPAVRAYTMLLCVFVFFLPLFIIVSCYVFIFRAVRHTNRAVGRTGGGRDSLKSFNRLQNEWKMAKIALIVILLYVVSWSPYAAVALTAFAGYSDMLTPYMNSVPAVIAKASAIHNPIIYAITHPKYRMALAKYIPCLGALLCIRPADLRSASSSFVSTRRSTVTSQSSDVSSQYRRQSGRRSRLSSASDSESGLTDTEADLASLGSRPASRQVSCDISRDTAELPDYKHSTKSSSLKSKVKNHDSGIFDKTSYDGVSMGGVSSSLPNSGEFIDGPVTRGAIGRIPSIVITSESSPFLPTGRTGSRKTRPKTGSTGAGPG